MIDLMRTAPDPTRTEAAVFLVRHMACCILEVRPTDARAIGAEAVDVIAAYLKGRGKRTARAEG
jgi:hypothetical protein